jgi:hypothetical protein
MESMFAVLFGPSRWSFFGALVKSLEVIVRQSCLCSFNTLVVQ